ncbi:MAG TPA: glycosyltransferase [Candidatus Sulfotelmatobacter sp.]|nr:glycosyltransferase [Candidatus Sulfotelmatobacter sp.]
MVSIIIVNYNLNDDILECLRSIFKSSQKTKFEVIVVDNSEKKILKAILKKKYPKVKYIKSDKNLGYGSGNNMGAEIARGEYLFILNPDTKIFDNTLDFLQSFIKKNKKTGIVSPAILDEDNNFLNVQGTEELTPSNIILSQSFLRKIFPKRNILNELKYHNWNKRLPREVKAVPGAALMISKKNFEKIGGFDENLFLYFEENDLSNKIRKLGYKLFIIPSAKILHKVARSTKKVKNIENIYKKSRFFYVKKYYGTLNAFAVEFLLGINKYSVFLFFILIISLFLRLINLSKSMIFIGDQGWFYLSAKDMLINGKIPLVGITSSHTWLHQGPLWTYMLSIFLKIFNFNPLSGAYLTALIGTLTVFLIYKFGCLIFSRNVGLIAALLYTASPLIVYSDRIPFDPTPIPFFVLFYFYSIFKWIKGNIYFFPLALFFLVVLYNLELATFTLFFTLVILLILGFSKKTDFFKDIKNKKVFIFSLIAVLIPISPVLIYDFSHGFKQTIVFFGWTLYKPLSIFFRHSEINYISNVDEIIKFLLISIQKIVLSQNLFIANLIFVCSLIYVSSALLRSKKILFDEKFLLLIILGVSFTGIILNQTPSDAYLPIIFPFVILSVSILFEFLYSYKFVKNIVLIVLGLVFFLNLITSFYNSQNDRFLQRTKAADKIIRLANGRKYNLIGKGLNSEFETFTMNYQYLLWWKGNEPSMSDQNIKFTILENEKNIEVKEK